jgi:hypothetical protein
MHDPLVVAFEIPRPWPQRSTLPAADKKSVRWRIRLHHDHVPGPGGCQDDPPHRDGAFPWWRPRSYSSFWRLAGRDFYWPPLITVWHREPGGHDALSVCCNRVQRADGTWKFTGRWRWHVHHWKIQVPPLQELRRRLLTRCAWCGGRSRKGDMVNFSHSWDGPRGRWWRGAPGLFHMDCSSIASAHAACLCERPVTEHDGYGRCARCEKFRAYKVPEEQLARQRELAAIPDGARQADTTVRPCSCDGDPIECSHEAAHGHAMAQLARVRKEVARYRELAQEANAEVARLRAGESDEPAAEGTTLTPAQFLRMWNDTTPERRLGIAARVLDMNSRDSACTLADHRGKLQELRRSEREARKAMLTLVKAAGGQVRIPARILVETDFDAEVLTMQDDPMTDEVICEARGGENEAAHTARVDAKNDAFLNARRDAESGTPEADRG